MKLRKRSEAAHQDLAVQEPSTPDVARTNGARDLGGIVETSRELAREIQKNAEEPPGGYDFKCAQRRASPIRPDLKRIVETQWVEDLNAAWMRIRGMLKVGEKRRSEHGHLVRALDEARELAEEATGLFVTAKLEAQGWERRNEAVFGAMWLEASRALEHEKKTGLRSKPLTDGDVRAKCATLWPDEWSEQERERDMLRLTVERMQGLAKSAHEKAEDIRMMLQKARG